VLLTGASIVLPGRAPVQADIVFDEDAPGADLRIVEIGDLGGITARDTIDAHGLFAHFAADAAPLAPGPAPAFVLRTGRDSGQQRGLALRRPAHPRICRIDLSLRMGVMRETDATFAAAGGATAHLAHAARR
jgi:hypothetical protein